MAVVVGCVALLTRCVSGDGSDASADGKGGGAGGGAVSSAAASGVGGASGTGGGVVNAKGEAYAGSAACVTCHKSIGDGYMHTAHAMASAAASADVIKGSFAEGKNIFSFNEYSQLPVSLRVVMQRRDSGFFQTAYINGAARRTERFGVVVGAGEKAQSYLYWRGHQLLQLPISYYTPIDGWVNSPGFPVDQIKFNRLIPAHCMECHATTATLLPATEVIPGPNPPAYFDREKILYGVGCENCHGPGARHVEWAKGHPAEKTGQFIVRWSKLGRERAVEACAVCHSGIRESRQPAFSFVAGDTLDHYFGPGPVADSSHAEVHGNQYGLLAASKCFRMSGTMTCTSCHTMHGAEGNGMATHGPTESGMRDGLAAYSQKCMSCHKPAAAIGVGSGVGAHGSAETLAGAGGVAAHFCSRKPSRGENITLNCIDCHMPVRASGLVNLMTPGQKQLTPLLVRSHLIAVYGSHRQSK